MPGSGIQVKNCHPAVWVAYHLIFMFCAIETQPPNLKKYIPNNQSQPLYTILHVGPM
jgi:hypothetical protein